MERVIVDKSADQATSAFSDEELLELTGASRIESLPADLASASDLAALRREVLGRLRSTGGRPTDPTWRISRVVPFNPDVWRQLQELSAQLRSAGASASAGQLAAFFVEQGLGGLSPLIPANQSSCEGDIDGEAQEFRSGRTTTTAD
jgi:hypothetical protein